MEEFQKSKNQLLSENLELRRIEAFLRAEVKELWTHIKNVESLPLYKLWIFLASRLPNIRKQISEATPKDGSKKDTLPRNNIVTCDFLFIYSSDSQEIGGLKTSGKLARDLIELESWTIKGLALNHNPTIENKDDFFIEQIDTKSSIKNVVACGSDTIEKAFEISKTFNTKFVLLMMGLDQIFAPTWQESKSFILAIQKADLVICLAPHLAEQAKLFGARNVVVAPLGFDERDFKYLGLPKKNKILVSCRISPEKGLKFVLPALSLLREKGWTVVGFGDLLEHESAEVFDVFLGRINAQELCNELQDAKFLIDPSWVEGLGLVALEAAACGVMPIITSRGDYQDLFEINNYLFFELINFINPADLISLIESNNYLCEPNQIHQSVKHLNWANGVKIAIEALKSI
jgi:glycosyltransferase involved in cell wall biosynthesis